MCHSTRSVIRLWLHGNGTRLSMGVTVNPWFFLGPRCGEIAHFVLIFKSSTRADLGDGRPASATCNTTTGARPITSTCIAQFDQPLEKFSYSALLSSLRSLSLYMVNVLHAPFPSQNQSNGAGHNNSEMDHWHGNSPPWQRSQPFATAPGRQKPCIVSFDTCFIYIYYLYLLVIYVLLLCKQGPRRAAETYDMNMCSYRTARENLRTEDRLTLQSKHTHRHTQCRDNIS